MRRHLPLADEARASDRAARPRYAVWEITLACDQACRHCGSRAGRTRMRELDTAECLDVVRQLANLGVIEVTIQGGEAYLRPDWLEVVRAIGSRKMICTMVTAGQGLDARSAAAAREAGLRSVSVSIDGTERTHDRLHGRRGARAAGLRGLRALREADVKIACNTQINRLTLRDLPELLEELIAERIFAWQIQLTMPLGRAADMPDVILQPYDILELYDLLPRLASRCAEAGVTFWPGNNIGYFGPHEALLRSCQTTDGHYTSCGAGRTILGIEADGEVKGCSALATAEWTGGNVRTHSLAEIWERAPTLRYGRYRNGGDLWGYCQHCYYADVCLAGCTATSFALFGRAGNNPYCHHRALEMKGIGKRERLVQTRVPLGEPFDHGVFELVVEDVR